MKRSLNLLYLLLGALVLLPLELQGIDPFPRMWRVTPDVAKAGEVLIVEGDYLGADYLADLYMTDGTNDLKTEIVEQKEDSLKFRIPATAKPGSYRLMVLTRGKEPKFLEEPVRVTVE